MNLNELEFSKENIVSFKENLEQIISPTFEIIDDISNIIPKNNKLYRYTVKENDVISFDFQNISEGNYITFELMLYVVDTTNFTFQNIVWINQPNFSILNTKYHLIIRYDGKNIIGDVLYNIDINFEDDLTLTALSNTTITLRRVGLIEINNLQIKKNDSNQWIDVVWGQGCDYYINLNQNEYIKIRNTTNKLSQSTQKYLIIGIKENTKVEATGNIMSLLNYSDSCHEYCFYRLFYNQIGLIKAPALPSTKIAQYCYAGMFCKTGINDMPYLPASQLSKYCYYFMFSSCPYLTTVTDLIASYVPQGGYAEMFSSCSSLQSSPNILAKSLGYLACNRMFKDCTQLVTGPINFDVQILGKNSCTNMFFNCSKLTVLFDELKPEYIPQQACYSMFNNCTSLTKSPKILATAFGKWACSYMFAGCTALEEAPALTAKLVDDYSYRLMFKDCTSLNSITVNFTEWNQKATDSWVTNVASQGVFNCPGDLPTVTGVSNIPEGWSIQYTTQNPLTLTAQTPGVSISLNVMVTTASRPITDYIKYRLSQDAQWQTYPFTDDTGLVITLANVGDYVQFRNFNDVFSYDHGGYIAFAIDGQTRVSGNILSLINYRIKYKFATFLGLFSTDVNSSKGADIINMPQLHDVQLTDYCYHGMFKNCSKLTEVSELSAKKLSKGCYQRMFQNCTSLVTAPQILAQQSNDASCHMMFQGCTALTTPPSKFYFSNVASSCCTDMFRNCVSLLITPQMTLRSVQYNGLARTFDKCISLEESRINIEDAVLGLKAFYTLFSNCTKLTIVPAITVLYAGSNSLAYMFQNCSSLTTAPSIAISQMDVRGCRRMFQNCTSLTSMPVLANMDMHKQCYAYMFQNCTSLTDVTQLPATQMAEQCYQGMFKGCTNLTESPNIKATNLAQLCFDAMFDGCTSLSSITTNFKNWYQGATTNWVNGVASTGIFNKEFNLPKNIGVDYIPEGWSIDCPNQTPLTFTADADNQEAITVKLYKANNPIYDGIQYRMDQSEPWQAYTIYAAISLNANESVQFRNTKSKLSISSNDYVQILASGPYHASGNMNSMINYELECPDYCFTKFFYNGNAKLDNYLITPPELPAKKVGAYSYSGMFQYCYNLTSMPQLTALSIGKYAYSSMFQSCTSVVDGITQLPATEVAQGCYMQMFQSCIGLVNSITEINITVAPLKAFRNMFYGTAITTAPKLNVDTMGQQACYAMFMNCTSLTNTNDLPANTLGRWAYSYMFAGCTALEEAPALTAKFVDDYSYRLMFKDCTALKSITVNFTEWNQIVTDAWVTNVASQGVFNCPGDLPTVTGVSNIPEGWQINRDNATPLRITAMFKNTDISIFLNNISFQDIDLYYRTSQNNTWTAVDKTLTQKFMYRLTTVDSYIQFWNKTQTFSKSDTEYFRFSFNNTLGDKSRAAVSGHIQSLLNYSNISPAYCFYSLFQSSYIPTAPIFTADTVQQRGYLCMFKACPMLTEAPQLPATKISTSSYSSMFYYCNTLAKAPTVLPATELANNCYFDMFHSCPVLATVPTLPARTVPDHAYYCMFYNCKALTVAPELPATSLGISCYAYMFYGTAITKAPALPATTLAPSCYSAMFRGCTSLVEAPQLPATDSGIMFQCYKNLFNGCTSLKKITIGFTTFGQMSNTQFSSGTFGTQTTYFTKGWVTGISTTQGVQFIATNGMSQALYGDDFIPATWQNLEL